MNKTVLPSLLSSDFSQFKCEMARLREAGVTHVHWDIMDGHFVPNLTFGPGVIAAVRPHTDFFFDTHLMVKEPSFLIPAFQNAGVDLLTIHWEAVTHVDRVIAEIHECGMQAGIALNPATPACVLEDILPLVDLVLVMTVNPGFGGQQFLPYTLDKMARLRRMIDASGCDIVLEVDGGINEKTMPRVVEAGVDWVVAGSAVFNADDLKTSFSKLNGCFAS
ncbi:MAG: ribulose-phosphate 3-epimerase [Peptoniphilaceae bacterium]|nr:ribulose-phosphate 3-epimerase [Peptoniphilaceae bacterium]